MGKETGLKLCIDLDGVVATDTKERPVYKADWDYSYCVPVPGAKGALEYLKRLGHTITLHSTRWVENMEVTLKWLAVHDIPYDEVVLGKPAGDVYLDDRGYRFTSWHAFLGNLPHIELKAK